MIRICGYCGLVYDKEEQGYNKYCSDKCATWIRRDRNRERARKDAGHEPMRFGDNLKCLECGAVLSKRRHGTMYCSKACSGKARDRSKHIPWDEWVDKISEQRAETERKKITERAERRKIRERAKRAEEKQKREQAKLIRDALFKKETCVVCGESFMTIRSSQVTCSDKCSRRWVRRKKDKRINSDNCIDHDITLSALFDRDNGRCYICGDECDWEDYKENDGNVCVGITYPSIDHVVPLSKGGMHSWANVKLAHHYCNTIKNDTITEQPSDEQNEGEARRTNTRTVNGKQVKQLTIEGVLLAVYKSTAEAERKTGIKQRGIQAAARGEINTSHGYVWSY